MVEMLVAVMAMMSVVMMVVTMAAWKELKKAVVMESVIVVLMVDLMAV